jgi:competence protein ComEC
MVLYCLSLLCGVFLSRYYRIPQWLWFGVPAVLFVAAALYKKPRAAIAAIAVASFAFGWLRGAAEFHAVRMPEQKGILFGTVREAPRREDTRSRIILTCATLDGRAVGSDVDLTVYGAFEAKAGDCVSLSCKLRPIENYPDATFDYKLWRLGYGVAYQASGSKAVNLGVDKSIRFYPARVSAALQTVIKTQYGGRAGMVIGMTLGVTQTMTQDEVSAFRAAGVSHILSVSGLHVGFIMLAVQWLLRKRVYVGTLRLLFTLLLLFGYCAVVGMPPPAVRATLMMALYVFAQWAGLKYDLLTALAFSAALIVLFRPAQLFAAGFCLSFAATAGIALFYKGIARNLARVPHLPKWAAQGVAVWVSAQIGILPAVLWFFGTLQVYGLLANLIIVPLSAVVTLGGLLSGLVGLAVPALGSLVSLPVGWGCTLIGWIAGLVASLPLAEITGLTVSSAQVAVYGAAAAVQSRFCLLPKRMKRMALMGSIGLLLMLAIASI